MYAVFSSLFIALNKRFHVAMGVFSNRSQKTSECGKNISDTLAYGSCGTSMLLPHFDFICDLLLNICTVTWNLLILFKIDGLSYPVGLAPNKICWCNVHILPILWQLVIFIQLMNAHDGCMTLADTLIMAIVIIWCWCRFYILFP